MTDTFAVITRKEIGDLATLRASACCWATYTSLLHYARAKVSCFPSLETIRKMLGNAYDIRSIQRAIKFLIDNGFVKRNERTSKQRFALLKRIISRRKEETTKMSQDHDKDVPIKKNKKNTSYLRGAKHKMKRFFDKRNALKEYVPDYQKEFDSMKVSDAEKPFESWLARNQDGDIKTIPTADFNTIRRCLFSDREEDQSWREIMSYSDENRRIFEQIKMGRK